MPNNSAANSAVRGVEDVLLNLCESVTSVLNAATHDHVRYSSMVQVIQKTCLKPDIASFVLFDGGFSGLVVINFSADAAMELYSKYLSNMGFPNNELAHSHTAPEVANVMGELLNQMVGDFTRRIEAELQTNITQSQPKMLVLNKEVMLRVDTNLDHPQARRISFYTGNNHVFYVELAMDDVSFIPLKKSPAAPKKSQKKKASTAENHDELLKSLGM